ncbi:MAG: molybdopterin-guanine dinucleotide biosynthesis protein B [Candidatus Bathyarchaeia archaeon]|nr:molybdopterin-guanine dinucleotide biosynthesis protein B [Candidatus Bathyarchaeota archaeon]
MIVVSVIGTKKSGKTKTIEYLISSLSKDGFKIGSIKHIHHPDFSIDTEGTDTWRHMHAGALVTAAFSPNQMVIIKRASIPDNIDQVTKVFSSEGLDFIFIEGFHSLCSKRTDILKIIVAKDPEDLRRTLEGTSQPILAITGPVAKERDKLSSEIDIPVVDLDCEGHILIETLKKIFEKLHSKAG